MITITNIVVFYVVVYGSMMLASPLAQACVSWDAACRELIAIPSHTIRLTLALLLVILWPIALVISLPLYPLLVAILRRTK